jgi:hypothetical protein
MLSYRLGGAGDRVQIASLWEETEWGSLTDEMWQRWYNHPFRGPATLCLAIDESGRIVGQLAFVPEYVSVRGRIVQAHRAAVPILAKSIRSHPVQSRYDHPAIRMYFAGVEELRARGEAFVYTFPDPRWTLLLRDLPAESFHIFPFWSRKLPVAPRPVLPPGYVAALIDDHDPRISELFARASGLHNCMTVRTAGTIRRKLFNGGVLIGIESSGSLVAVVGCAPKKKDWQICDLLSIDLGPSLEAALIAAIAAGQERGSWTDANGKSYELKKAGLLVTPALEPAAHALGFERDLWDFPLLVDWLNDTVEPEEIAPGRWYCSQND